jgi:hypothetical protein
MCDVADIEWLMRRNHGAGEWLMRRNHGAGKFLRPLAAERTGNMAQAHAWPSPPAAEGGRVKEAVFGFLTILSENCRVRRKLAGHNIPDGRFQ